MAKFALLLYNLDILIQSKDTKIWFILNIKNINICNVGPNTNGIGYISKHDTDFLQKQISALTAVVYQK